MLKKFLLLAALLAPLPAAAQSTVQYVSPVTRGHAAVWNTNGVIADGGSSASSPITSLGVTNNGGAGICVNSALPTAPGYNSLCLGANTTGPATISLQNFGTATAQNLQFVVNGTPVILPTGGSNFLIQSGTPVSGHLPCYSGTSGLVVDCGTSIGAGAQFGLPYYSTSSSLGSTGAGLNGQLLIGQTSSVPLWASLSGDVSSVSAAGLVTLGKVNGIPFASTYAANGVLIAEGTNQFHSVSTLNIGQCLLSQGASDPIFASCASGAGSAGGSNTQVQFNNSTALGGSPNFTWASPTLTLGVAGSVTGQLGLASSTTTGTVTLQSPGVSSAYNFNFPTGAGSLGQPLLSGGGGSTPNTFGILGIVGGGTNCTSASGTCLDNITGFSSTGFVSRTGSGSYAFSLVIPVSSGGTGLANGTSGGILGFTGAGTIASSATLSQFGLVVGGGAGNTPTAVTNGSAGQILIAQTSANPSWNTASGDVTINAAGVHTIAAGAVTVAKQANVAAFTLEGNFTGSNTAPQFSTIGALTQKASPASGDYILLQDNAAAGALKYAQVSSIASAGSVASIAGNTGAFTLNGLLTNSTNVLQVVAATKSDEQAGSSTTLATTPSQQQSHPSALKAAGSVANNGVNGAQAVTGFGGVGYNITSATRTATGLISIIFTTPFALGAYACIVTAQGNGSNNAFAQITNGSKGTNGFGVGTFINNTTLVDNGFDFMCDGSQ